MFKKRTKILLAILAVLSFGTSSAALDLSDFGISSKKTKNRRGSSSLSQGEVGSGLKEALMVGVGNAVDLASRFNGFYKNPLIFIPFPPEAQQMKMILEKVGFKPQIEKFIMTMNHAAEEAAKRAAPIFISAIKGLTIQDAFQILNGGDTAATDYLRRKTSKQLVNAFRPEVRQAIQKVEVTKYWKPLVSRYNQIPLMKNVNPNLDQYICERAVSGIFKLIANEERQIRKNPAARVNDLLRRVFGS